ncbi:MAG: hypothetical protein E7423_00855 [Ruminococcaceae bacterium]|nr:hypothetical protein [Oscillospiraceae bacterium]
MAFDFLIRTERDMVEAVNVFGFVPLFENSIPGFSIEEHVAREAWFGSGQDGVWEWKGPVIRDSGCAYGKFFERKAAFVSAEWFPDLANWRRDGYDFDSRYEEGLASREDKYLYDLLSERVPIISKQLKKLGDYRKSGRKGFDQSIMRLQSQCYVTISDFVYLTDKSGQQYGWGVGEYTTPERRFGEAFTKNVYAREPEESLERIVKHLKTLLPRADEKAIRRFLK